MNPGSSLPKGFSAPISLGEGGQARTWLAWQDQPGRWVVVKNDPKDRGELRAEADLLARLSGAPVPSLLDKDLDAPKPWIAMDWIDGLRLDRLPQDFETQRKSSRS
jgi:aminoglycoside phosphotransferase